MLAPHRKLVNNTPFFEHRRLGHPDQPVRPDRPRQASPPGRRHRRHQPPQLGPQSRALQPTLYAVPFSGYYSNWLEIIIDNSIIQDIRIY